jgi:hypothetical protein
MLRHLVYFKLRLELGSNSRTLSSPTLELSKLTKNSKQEKGPLAGGGLAFFSKAVANFEGRSSSSSLLSGDVSIVFFMLSNTY